MIELPIEFKEKVINRKGDEGKVWLENINKIIEKYVNKFNLYNLKLAEKLSINVVLYANSAEYGEVILKIVSSSETAINEMNYIRLCPKKYFEKCYYYNIEDRVILLEKISPGYPLSDIKNQEERIIIFCNIINDIVSDAIPKRGFKTLESRLNERINLVHSDKEKYKEVLDMASVADNLYQEIKSMNLPKYVLHEDLHHKNILKSKKAWKVIDPHGVIGEKVFDTTQFIRSELGYSDLSEIDKIVALISKFLSLEKNLIYKALYIDIFMKLVFYIRSKYDINKIQNNINICEKIYKEYIKKNNII